MERILEVYCVQGPQPKRRFYYRQVVNAGFCLKDFGQTNEQQRHFNVYYFFMAPICF
jgi:hypothetical protein